MDFNEYQKKSRETALYPHVGKNFVYPTLGLVGEAGEVADKLKKTIRDDDHVITEKKRQEVQKELGDVLWYVAQVASELDLSLDEIAKKNIEKLFSRKDRGKIGGSGDDR
jgi:NTP pyrophosphatase (non-canonical NTP hydrolase)